jgi:hypothetical protein
MRRESLGPRARPAVEDDDGPVGVARDDGVGEVLHKG